MNELLFDRRIKLREDERNLCLKCARSAMARLRRSRQLDGIFSPLRSYSLMWCLSSYALFLREAAAGRKIRYRKLTEIAVAGASVMGDDGILRILKKNGIEIQAVRWSWHKLMPVTLAVMGKAEGLAKKLLVKYPAMLDKDDREENLKACVRYGSASFVEYLLDRMRVKLLRDKCGWVEMLSTALFSAVASDRRETIALIMRLGADGSRAVTDGSFPAHCESSLFSCAVDNKNFEFADVCLARGWIPDEDDIGDLPNTANAFEDLDKFKYLCRAFPAEDFKKDVLEYWYKDYQVSPEVYAFCGGTGCPHPEGTCWGVEGYSDEEIMADFNLLRVAIGRNPDRVFDFAERNLSCIQQFFSTPSAYHMAFFPAYLFRKAKSMGVDIFGSKESERKFVESIPDWLSDCYRAHLSELGWAGYRLQENRRDDAHESSEKERLYECAAKAKGAELKKFLDDPAFDPNAGPYVNWSFAQEVRCLGTPRTFKEWALRGMDTYGQNAEGNYAIDGAEMPRWRVLKTVFGMNPLHIAYDGSSALGCAIGRHDDETAKWMWLHGDHSEWWGDSPLRLSLLKWNDELARWFKAQGVKNVDSKGREYPIPSWV